MSLQCPRCSSLHIAQKRSALKIGASIGAISGMSRSITQALPLSSKGASIGSLAGPWRTAIGVLAGAVLAGLAGAVGGCLVGAQLGERLDRQVLLDKQCQDCGYSFNTHITVV